jgi:hypothetical protein
MGSRCTNLFVLIPRESISGERALYFEQELAQELGPHHALFGRTTRAVAITRESDDVLFEFADGTFAQVHLTYTRNPPEMAAGCPGHRAFETLADWMIERMIPEHIDRLGL